jgi:hypothetical protein
LFHLLDERTHHPVNLTELADRFDVSERVIEKTIQSRKKMVRIAPRETKPHPGGWRGDWRKEIDQ